MRISDFSFTSQRLFAPDRGFVEVPPTTTAEQLEAIVIATAPSTKIMVDELQWYRDVLLHPNVTEEVKRAVVAKLRTRETPAAARLRDKVQQFMMVVERTQMNSAPEPPAPELPPRVYSLAGEGSIPYHTIAFSQQKLRAMIRRGTGHDPALAYGFVVHARRQEEVQTLGVITLGGESLELTPSLLKSLEGIQLWLFGHAKAALRPGTAIAPPNGSSEDDTARLTMARLEITTFAAGEDRQAEVAAQVNAATLVQPLIMLTETRPPNWPL
jgi:hypothetical protein